MASSRFFHPILEGFHAEAKPSDIVVYDDDNEVSRISQNSRHSRMPVVIWIGGASRRNGEGRASYGVYTGQDSRYNTSGCVPGYGGQTKQAAAIYAATHVVTETLFQMGSEVCKDGVVIVSDSAYLVRTITGYLYTRVVNANGGRDVNGEAYEALNHHIISWEKCGARIRFWKVTREQNQHAHRLANAFLRSEL